MTVIRATAGRVKASRATVTGATASRAMVTRATAGRTTASRTMVTLAATNLLVGTVLAAGVLAAGDPAAVEDLAREDLAAKGPAAEHLAKEDLAAEDPAGKNLAEEPAAMNLQEAMVPAVVMPMGKYRLPFNGNRQAAPSWRTWFSRWRRCSDSQNVPAKRTCSVSLTRTCAAIWPLSPLVARTACSALRLLILRASRSVMAAVGSGS